MAQIDEAGGDPVSLGVAPDRLEEIEARLRWGLDCDLVISSAGVSVGEHDFVKAALERLGAEQHLWLVDMRPGKPIAFATIPSAGKRALPVFALPGNPVSAMVTFELFVRPALLRLGGHARLQRPVVRARAEAPIANPGRRRGYLRVTLSVGEDGGYRRAADGRPELGDPALHGRRRRAGCRAGRHDGRGGRNRPGHPASRRPLGPVSASSRREREGSASLRRAWMRG